MRECTCGALQLPPGPHEGWCDIYQDPPPTYAELALELPSDWGADLDAVDHDPWGDE